MVEMALRLGALPVLAHISLDFASKKNKIRTTNDKQTKPSPPKKSAASSVAAAAGRGFGPFLTALLPLLAALMRRTEDEWLRARARATECAGVLAAAEGGAEALAAALPGLMSAALDGRANLFILA